MDVYVLDRVTQYPIDIVNGYTSILWNPRYYDVGDFEIYLPANKQNFELFSHDRYVARNDSDMVGIIETIKKDTDIDGGDYLIISGRDLSSILDRRIIWNMTNVSGTVESCIRQLITDNLISPANADRRIENFVLGPEQGFTETMNAQYTGDNLLEVIITLCKQYKYGFKVILNAENKFEFQLYDGMDRSYNQTVNPYVVFAPEFENIVSASYEHNRSTLKNACNVAGEGEGAQRKYYAVGSTSGLDRRELFVDARDVSSTGENDVVLSTDAYNNLLSQRGKETLAENTETLTFEGEVESVRQYVFGRDYDLGDTVTVKDKFGVTANPKIIAVIESHDSSGVKIIPEFETMEVRRE